jgi:tRNA-Thr(GGU) m(6)t(6)A37 methyltransferase TsaA
MEATDKKRREKPAPEMKLRPVGVVCSPLRQPTLVAEDGDLRWKPKSPQPTDGLVVADIIIDEDLDGILDGIEEFSHLLVLFWAHMVPPEGRTIIKGHPMGRKDMPLTGIFATCSPARPNTICATVVRLLERRCNILTVEGLDALDGSPVVDIKPYNPSYYPEGEVRLSGWLDKLCQEFAQAESGNDGHTHHP